MKHVLHVGCGTEPLPSWLQGLEETRLDIKPPADIVADMRHLPPGIGPFDVVLCHHSLEHIYPHEVGRTLAGFVRVLVPGGLLVVVVPDLTGIEATDDVLFEAAAGPISGLDLIYGFRPMIEEHPEMAHHTGFVPKTLEGVLREAGCKTVKVIAMPPCHNMCAIGAV